MLRKGRVMVSKPRFLRKHVVGLSTMLLALVWLVAPAAAQQKPNIIMIMGDDIGIWNIGAYHRGMMAARTPNLDRLAAEGMLFTDYYAEASCTAGRANFITGEIPLDRKSTRLNSSHLGISYAV